MKGSGSILWLTLTMLPESLAFVGICIWNILPTTAEESGKLLGCATEDATACASWRSKSTEECMEASSCAMSPSTSKVPWGDEAWASASSMTVSRSSAIVLLPNLSMGQQPASRNLLSLLRILAFVVSLWHKEKCPVEGAACTPPAKLQRTDPFLVF